MIKELPPLSASELKPKLSNINGSLHNLLAGVKAKEIKPGAIRKEKGKILQELRTLLLRYEEGSEDDSIRALSTEQRAELRAELEELVRSLIVVPEGEDVEVVLIKHTLTLGENNKTHFHLSRLLDLFSQLSPHTQEGLSSEDIQSLLDYTLRNLLNQQLNVGHSEASEQVEFRDRVSPVVEEVKTAWTKVHRSLEFNPELVTPTYLHKLVKASDKWLIAARILQSGSSLMSHQLSKGEQGTDDMLASLNSIRERFPELIDSEN